MIEYDEEQDKFIIRTMQNMQRAWEDDPRDHLYEWLKKANPKVFKQWEAIWNIQRSVDD